MRLRSIFLLLAVAACANDAEQPESAADSAIAAPVFAPQPDTLMSRVDMRCANGTEIRANIWVGTQPRAVIATHDTGLVLPPTDSADGAARYATADGRASWVVRGDSGVLTFRGTTTACGPAADVAF